MFDMKNLFLMAVVSLTVVALQGCDNEDVTKQVSKDGSIETELSVLHINDKQDVLTTTHKIWISGTSRKYIVHKDTIPSLGVTNQDAENDNGDAMKVSVKKDYEFYVTVK